MSELPKVGFIGVGTIAEALITGLCVGGEQRATFLLSPRNAAISKGLADRFPSAVVAANTQSVIDGSDIIFLAVRPQVAAEVLGPLEFRADQRIVSLIATFNVERLRPLVAPASSIVRAAPLPVVARRMGALAFYPPVAEIASLLEGLGQLIQLNSESQLDALWAVTGLMCTYFGLLGEIAGWLARQNVPDLQARPFVAATFAGLAVTAAERSGDGFDRLLADHATAGGLNEQAYRELQAAGWTGLLSQTLDLIHARMRGQAGYADRIPVNRTST